MGDCARVSLGRLDRCLDRFGMIGGGDFAVGCGAACRSHLSNFVHTKSVSIRFRCHTNVVFSV